MTDKVMETSVLYVPTLSSIMTTILMSVFYYCMLWTVLLHWHFWQPEWQHESLAPYINTVT